MVTGKITGLEIPGSIFVDGKQWPLKAGAKGLKGSRPGFVKFKLNDLKNGDHVALHGPPKEAEVSAVRLL